MRLPEPDPSIIGRRDAIVAALADLLPPGGVVADPDALAAYECDALTIARQRPLAVALPETTEQVSRVLAWCAENGVNVVPRGAGTSLSGGAMGLADGITVGVSRLNRILEVDIENRCVVCQPGVTNQAITDAVAPHGFYYAPDPSSQIACSIGGNVAENAGGVHCLKYGVTTNNLLGVEVVLPDGRVARAGGRHLDAGGYDLLGLMTGSEGLLGVVTEVTVRILPRPETARALLAGFPSTEAAGRCVAAVIAGGIVPAAIEIMDGAAIQAAEDFVHAGYPLDAEALLIVELDGPARDVDVLLGRVEALALEAGATSLRTSRDDAERQTFWAGRKAAFPAVGRISPDYLCMDGTIPRRRLPEVLVRIGELSHRHGLRVANVFHAGDGNLHPLIMFDANAPGEMAAAEAFGADILRLCVEVGGVLTGEHGVGVEKRELMAEMFTDTELDQQRRLKAAFDPDGRMNPGKVYPTPHGCGELGAASAAGGTLPGRLAHLPRF